MALAAGRSVALRGAAQDITLRKIAEERGVELPEEFDTQDPNVLESIVKLSAFSRKKKLITEC